MIRLCQPKFKIIQHSKTCFMRRFVLKMDEYRQNQTHKLHRYGSGDSFTPPWFDAYLRLLQFNSVDENAGLWDLES